MLQLSKELSLPIDFVQERIAIVARTGAGKSGGMRVMFEEMLNQNQFVIFIDPKGDAWGIRASGKGKGYPVLVMGGDHADVPLDASAGKFTAEFLVRERVPAVLDISDFGKADMNRFVADLASTLYRKNRDCVHVFLDEADMVAGERFYDPHCLEAIQLIQNKGRFRGFGMTVTTQRTAMVNKSVLFASGTLIAMQTLSPRDIKVVREYLEVCGTPEATKQIISELPVLKTREALVYSPQHLGPEPRRIMFREFRTFDSMRAPKPGETRQQPKKLADINLDVIKRDMAATIEQVQANDPKLLKARIQKLEHELALKNSLPKLAPAAKVKGFTEKQVHDLVLKERRARDRHWLGQVKKLQDRNDYVEERLTKVVNLLGALHVDGKITIEHPHDTVPTIPVETNGELPRPERMVEIQPFPMPSMQRKAAAATHTAANGDEVKLGKAELAVLQALYWVQHDQVIDESKLAFYSGYSPAASTVGVALSKLRKVGYVQGFKITRDGEGAVPRPDDAKPTGTRLRDWLRPKLDKAANAVLDVLIDYPYERQSEADLAHATGYSPEASTVGVALSRLRKVEAIEGGAREGGVMAARIFFE